MNDGIRITHRADCSECDWWMEGPDSHEVEKELRRHFKTCHPSTDNPSVADPESR